MPVLHRSCLDAGLWLREGTCVSATDSIRAAISTEEHGFVLQILVRCHSFHVLNRLMPLSGVPHIV